MNRDLESAIDSTLNKLNKDLRQTSPRITPIDHNPLAIQGIKHLTDLGNAERFVSLYGSDIRYCHPTSTWYVWDGLRWAPDESAMVHQFARQTIRLIYSEEGSVERENDRREIARHALKSESDARLKAMVNLASSEKGVPVLPIELDVNPWLLNCSNGTLDLKRGELRGHRREDMITKLAPVQYDPEAKNPIFEAFLKEATGEDEELAKFLQQAAGYSLTGDMSEEVLFFIYGPTASGKSTFTECFKATLGDYALTADFSTFLKSSHTRGPRSDIARLAGSRIVISTETDEGSRLAEGLVKHYVGGDTLVARHLYQKEIEFKQRGKLWLVANSAPRASDSDEALWRRIDVIPFEHSVPEEKRDPNLKTSLSNVEYAGPAILAWAVKGCLEWQQEGLKTPESVKQATMNYRKEVNLIEGFIQECCQLGALWSCSSRDLWESYKRWAEESGIKYPVKRLEFSKHLKSYGLEPAQIGPERTRSWQGIDLNDKDANT